MTAEPSKEKGQRMRSDAFFITKNGEDAFQEYVDIKPRLDCLTGAGEVLFYALTFEIGTETGNPHFHAVVKTNERKGLRWYHDNMPELKGANFQMRALRATWARSIGYLKYIDGEGGVENCWYRQGGIVPKESADGVKRGSAKGGEIIKTRYENAYSLAKLGQIEEIDKEIYLKYFKSINEIARLANHTAIRTTLVDVWVEGTSGCGKSRWAREFCTKHNFPYYLKAAGNKWWDGYEGEPVVIIDDVSRQSLLDVDYFKTWTDHYPFNAEVKGGMLRNIRPKMLIFTSNAKMSQIWDNIECDLKPLQRRISEHTIGVDPFGNKMLVPHISKRSSAMIEIVVQGNDTRYDLSSFDLPTGLTRNTSVLEMEATQRIIEEEDIEARIREAEAHYNERIESSQAPMEEGEPETEVDLYSTQAVQGSPLGDDTRGYDMQRPATPSPSSPANKRVKGTPPSAKLYDERRAAGQKQLETLMAAPREIDALAKPSEFLRKQVTFDVMDLTITCEEESNLKIKETLKSCYSEVEKAFQLLLTKRRAGERYWQEEPTCDHHLKILTRTLRHKLAGLSTELNIIEEHHERLKRFKHDVVDLTGEDDSA